MKKNNISWKKNQIDIFRKYLLTFEDSSPEYKNILTKINTLEADNK